MSVECEKCGADISVEWEEHPNCDTVVKLRSRLARLEAVAEAAGEYLKKPKLGYRDALEDALSALEEE